MNSLEPIKAFTLIELLMTLAIIGILAAIAMPQYNHVITRVYRVEVLQELVYIANLQEQYALDHGEYADDLTLLGLKSSPILTESLRYRIDVKLTEENQRFVLSAQALTDNEDESEVCDFLSINELGEKYPSAHCWR